MTKNKFIFFSSKYNQDDDSQFSDSDDDNVDPTDRLYRIKPKMHMRKDEPEARPRAAIFRFRDNEYSTHAEVKYLLETQLGVRVKTVQYDPLDIRATKPDVYCRWIVEFCSDMDLNKALQKGLVVGKDKLIFYKHDDIATREVKSFKYFQSVLKAKHKFKSKQTKSSRSESSKMSATSFGKSKRQTSTQSTQITSDLFD